MYKLGKESRAQLDTVAIELRVLFKEAIKGSPHDFKVTEGYRSIARQQKLYRQGRTEPGPIVTKCDGERIKSKHQSGKAVDIAIWENGKPNYNTKKLLEVRGHVNKIAKELGIKLKKIIDWDLPHYEI